MSERYYLRWHNLDYWIEFNYFTALLIGPIVFTEANDMNATTENLRHEEMMANIAKLNAETLKLNKEIKWYEITIIIAGTLAAVAVLGLALSALVKLIM